jgi:hypothetical protein
VARPRRRQEQGIDSVIPLDEIASGGQVLAWMVAGLGLLVPRVYEPNRRQHYIWKFKGASAGLPKIVIETVEGGETDLYHRPSTGYGAVAAVAQLTNAINASRQGFFRRTNRSLENPLDLCFSTDQIAEFWCRNHDIVLVGGPKHNRLTAQVLHKFGRQPDRAAVPAPDLLAETAACRLDGDHASHLGIATQGATLYWYGHPYEGSVTDKAADPSVPRSPVGPTGVDYGVVLRLPGHRDAHRRLIVVFGSQTYGVTAASMWLVNVRTLRAITPKARRMMGRHRNIAVLVRADVNDGVLSPPEMVDIVALPDPLPVRAS